MVRTSTLVRSATNADLPDLLTLWQELRDETPRRTGRGGIAPSTELAEARLLLLLEDPSARLVVAETDAGVVGMALYRITITSNLLDSRAVELSNVCVARGRRRRGVGRALVAAAATYADEVGVEHLVVNVQPAQREANRFWARLGFGPVAVRRMTTVAAVRRLLSAAGEQRVLTPLSMRRPAMRRRRVPAPAPSRDAS